MFSFFYCLIVMLCVYVLQNRGQYWLDSEFHGGAHELFDEMPE